MQHFSVFFRVLPLLLLCCQAGFAHNGSLRGTVYDAETHAALEGAQVYLPELRQGSASDVFGTFRFSDLPSGSYQVRISFVGFETQQFIAEVRDNETTRVSAVLKPSVLELQEATVHADPQQSLQTISGIDIRLRPANNAQDLLRLVPGLFIAQHAGGGKAEQIFLRGFDIDHGTDVALSVDGMPVNMVSHAHGQGYADLHFLIPETVEGIGFQKGPYFAQQGNLATAGSIQFSTRTALDKSQLKLEGGRFNTARIVGLFDLLGEQAKKNHQNAYIATEYAATNGYFESPQQFTRFNFLAKYTGLIAEDKVLSASASHFRSRWDASGQVPLRAIEQSRITRFGAIDPTEGGETSRSNLNLQLTKYLTERSYLKNRLYLVNYQFELYSNFTFFLRDSLNGDQIRQKENRNIIGYQTAYSREDNLGNRRLSSELGATLRYDNVKGLELSRTRSRREVTQPLSLGTVNETNAAVYLAESLALSQRVTVTAGIRYDAFVFDYVNDLDSVFQRQVVRKGVASPKLNLFYTLSPALRLYAQGGYGFHSNDTRVAVAQRGQRMLPRALGTDAGFIWKPFEKLLLQAAAWQLYMEQEFVYVGDEAVVEPSGRTRRTGVDFSVRYQLNRWLYADADLTLARPRSLDASEREHYLPLAPTFTSIGGLSARFESGFSGSLRYRYLADRPANEDYSTTAQGYTLLDAVLLYTQPRYELGLSAENLLNSAWREAQFDTESRLKDEAEPVTEIHFTPGTPFFLKASVSYFF